ncbi:hypothetical protein ONZ45_g1313 [Pleurotus djamor]|nr:hypothetical protein ONZ45_g1313 [Pleurotus djamor]
MSHNFFSFLEPGANGIVRSNEDDLHTQPTPTPVSPWNPISPFPNSADAHSHHSHSPSPSPNPSVLSDLPSQNGDATHPFPPGHSHPPHHSVGLTGLGPKVAGATQFLLGAWVWVTGQQIGSLSCTGLGYWIVFDAFGVGIGVWAGKNLRSSFEQADDKQRKLRIRRPYGNARVETLLMFAQAVYLMFSSVYVCKETVEHLLLSAGAGAGVGGGVGSGGHSDGHHHHHGGTDEAGEFLGIEFPIFLTLTALFSLFYTAVAFGNHGKLLRVSGNRIPSVGTLIRRFTRSISRATSRSSSYAFDYEDPPTSILGDVLSNPYVASPLFFAFSLLCIPYGFDESQHHLCDLVLACVITVVTFNVAYQASVVLGTVLLQTSPPRGSSGSSKMDSFLRVIKEIERHPQVVHMPPPHIWQLTPSAATPVLSQGTSNSESLVVTLELHVKENLGDDDVLRLTSWAWDKCVTSLRGRGEDSRSNDADVTVGVVRG